MFLYLVFGGQLSFVVEFYHLGTCNNNLLAVWERAIKFFLLCIKYCVCNHAIKSQYIHFLMHVAP